MSAQQDSRALPPWWIITRDVLLFLAGLVLVFWEVSRPEIRDSVLILAGSLLGGPTAALGVTGLASAIASRGGTGSPSSPSAADPPSPSSAPSPSGP